MTRNSMSEADKDEARRRARHRAYLKAHGKGGLVDATPTQQRIRHLHDQCDVTLQRISDRTGVDLKNIKMHYRGLGTRGEPLTVCQWKTHNAVLTTRFGPEDVGTIVRACGTLRRLQALVHAGYSQAWLAAETGRSLTQFNTFILSNRPGVDARHAARVEELYRKYSLTDPHTLGHERRSITYAHNTAVKRDWAPVMCWDDDTIDQPDAFPEWTGECGTVAGYYLHLKHDILVKNYGERSATKRGNQKRFVTCQPCKEARAAESASQKMGHPQEVRDRILAQIDAGETVRAVAADHGVSTRTVERYKRERRAKETADAVLGVNN
ncbi:hypothetical protein [Streptomyces sp. NPDC055085]